MFSQLGQRRQYKSQAFYFNFLYFRRWFDIVPRHTICARKLSLNRAAVRSDECVAWIAAYLMSTVFVASSSRAEDRTLGR
jgi:hypothetical protein